MEEKRKSAGVTVAWMIAATLLSKLLGMVRGVLVAGLFADSPAGVAFAAASGIPLSLFDMLFSAAILGSFLPIYKGAVADEARARRFSSAFLTTVTAVTALASLLGVLLAKPILLLAAPKLEGETAALAVALLRIMFPSMVFAGMAYTLVGILQSHEHFLLPSLVSALSNALILLYLLLCGNAPTERAVYGLAAVYLLSWGVQFLTLAVPLGRMHKLPPPTAHLQNDDLRLALRRALPVLFGSWLLPAGSLLSTAFSSLVGDSALAAFSYAFSVYSILMGVLTYGVCNFLFPHLSAQAAAGERQSFALSLRRGVFASLAMVLPVTVAVALLSREGVCLLYLRGNFSVSLAETVAESLRALSPAMPALCLFELLSRAAYASGRVRAPMIAALAGVGAHALVAALFLAAGKLSVSSVAAACAVGQIVSALLLAVLLCRAYPELRRGIRLRKPLSLLLSLGAAAGTMAGIRRLLQNHAMSSSFARNFLTAALVFLSGLVVYLIGMLLSGAVRLPSRKGGISR